MKNALTYEKMPQYMIKFPQGANTDAQTENGTQPNQRFFFLNSLEQEIQPNFQKSPIFKTLSINSA